MYIILFLVLYISQLDFIEDIPQAKIKLMQGLYDPLLVYFVGVVDILMYTKVAKQNRLSSFLNSSLFEYKI